MKRAENLALDIDATSESLFALMSQLMAIQLKEELDTLDSFWVAGEMVLLARRFRKVWPRMPYALQGRIRTFAAEHNLHRWRWAPTDHWWTLTHQPRLYVALLARYAAMGPALKYFKKTIDSLAEADQRTAQKRWDVASNLDPELRDAALINADNYDPATLMPVDWSRIPPRRSV